jgi:protein-disulfide isomerase
MAKSNHSQSEKVVNLDVEQVLLPGSILGVGILLMLGMVISSVILGNALRAGGFSTGTGTAVTTTPSTTDTGTVTNVTQDQILALFQTDNMTFGNKDSNLLIVEVADPSCPYCHIAAGLNPELNKSAGSQFTLVADGGSFVAPVPEIRKLVEEGKAGYVWIYSNGHGNGEMGTKAMYCAYENGKFWEVHGLLFTSAGYDIINNTIKNDKGQAQTLANFLASAMNAQEMVSCLNSGKYDDRIAADQATANSLGVTGTPGYFINTRMFPGAYSFTEMQSTIEAAL